MNKTVLFYCNVKTKKQFSIQGFYRTDIQILKELGFQVKLSCHWYDFFKFLNYEIAFLYFYRFSLIPAVISRFFHKKVFFTGGIDSLDEKYVGRKSFIIQAILFKICNLFSHKSIIVSSSDLKNIQKIYRNKIPKNVILIPHCIDFDKYAFEFNTIKEPIITTICWMGRIENVNRKGVDKVLNIFTLINKTLPEYKLYIIGSKGHGSLLLEDYICKNGLHSNVILTDALCEEDKIALLKRSKYYFQLSEYEGFGIGALEALASGNIVFHSGVGGLNEGIGPHGILIKDTSDTSKIENTFLNVDENYEIWKKNIPDQILHVKNNFSFNRRKNAIQLVLQ